MAGPSFGPPPTFGTIASAIADEFTQQNFDELAIPDIIHDATAGGNFTFAFTDGQKDQINGAATSDSITITGNLPTADADRYVLGGGTSTITMPDNSSGSMFVLSIVEPAAVSSGSVTVNVGDGGSNLVQVINDSDGSVTDTSQSVTLIGGTGTDILKGSAAADTLRGGGDADTLTGNCSTDTFQFAATGDFGDTITDFTAGTDKFDFTGAVETALSPGGDEFYNTWVNPDVRTIDGLFEFASGTVKLSGTQSATSAATAGATTLVAASMQSAVNSFNIVVLYDEATTANAGVYYVANDGTEAIASSEVSLVAFLEGVGDGALTHADFSDFVQNV